jgi:hypothetical protein
MDSGGSIPSGYDFPLRYVNNSCGAHPTSYTVGTR